MIQLGSDQLHNFKQLCFLTWSKSLSVEISLPRAAGGLTFQQYLQCRPANFRHSTSQRDSRRNGILARVTTMKPPQDGIAQDEAECSLGACFSPARSTDIAGINSLHPWRSAEKSPFKGSGPQSSGPGFLLGGHHLQVAFYSPALRIFYLPGSPTLLQQILPSGSAKARLTGLGRGLSGDSKG